MTVIFPITTLLLAVLFILVWAHLGLGIAVALTLIGIMAMLVHAIEPNLAAALSRRGEQ